ncbi:MAG: hypothetical protein HY465_03050 [Deltaproteobacteria bacterium]|nr:hypothetical protein [Deltaproteobacteria bacterium]
MYRKLNLDRDKVDRCRDMAKRVAAPVLRYIEHHSTVAIERATLKLVGADPNVVDTLTRDQLRRGACSWMPSVQEKGGREALGEQARAAVRRLDGIRIQADPVGMRLARLSSDDRFGKDDQSFAPTPDDVASRIFDRCDGESCDPIALALFGASNVKRAFIDGQFVRKLFVRAGVITRTREDELLHRLDAYRHGHQALVSLFLNEQFATAADMPPEIFGVTTTFAIDPAIESSALFELAFAQVVRELFLRNPFFFALRGDQPAFRRALFHTIGIISEVNVRLGDRDAAMFSNALHDVGDELLINPNGLISRRAHTVLENAFKLLQRVETQGLLESLAGGVLADVACAADGGEGFDGVFQKERGYWNPILDLLAEEQTPTGEPEIVVEEKPAPGPEVVKGSAPAAPKSRGRRRRRGRGRGRKRSGPAPAAPAIKTA